MSNSQPLPGIEHVILLMFENRSFDNMLGAFYPYSSQYPDRGGVPPTYFNIYNGGKVLPWQAPPGSAAQIIPYPDPWETFVHMTQQIHAIWGPMMGFAADYASVPGDPRAVLQYYVADNVPVTYALAMAYAASDCWFASGPVQTWPNRLFSICGTPGLDTGTGMAYLDNTDYPEYPLIWGQLYYSSIFEQLDDAGLSWRVYHDDEWPIAALVNYVWEHWDWVEDGGNVWPFSTFFDDVAGNTLPTFSLIEPRYQMKTKWDTDVAPTSNHPGSSLADSETGPPISVSCGERMLAQVVQALAANPTLFAKTLLVVTYDEHGGLFDHVLPPLAPIPFTQLVHNFSYDEYGVRVPTLFVNPYVNEGLYPASPGPAVALDHTSLLATLRDQFGLAGSLSPRVDKALTLTGLVDPSRQPIPAPNIPLPACVWSPSATQQPAEPILRSLLHRSALKVRRPTR